MCSAKAGECLQCIDYHCNGRGGMLRVNAFTCTILFLRQPPQRWHGVRLKEHTTRQPLMRLRSELKHRSERKLSASVVHLRGRVDVLVASSMFLKCARKAKP